MDVEEFQALLAQHGSDLEDWPPNLRSAGHILCALNSTAKSLLDEDRALRALFAEQPEIRAPSSLVDRIVAAAHRSSDQRR